VGDASDPYQPLETQLRLTRAVLGEFAQHGGVHVEICTRSPSVLADLDVLRELLRVGSVRVTVSIPSAPRDIREVLEPHIVSVEERLKLVEELAGEGIPVGVEASPIFPSVGDGRRTLRRLVCAVAQARGRYLRGRLLCLPPGIHESFFLDLETVLPEQVERYRRIYVIAREQAPPGASERTMATFNALRRQYRLPEELPWPTPEGALRSRRGLPLAGRERQIGLFEAA
jgi:DNA repair photolyase